MANQTGILIANLLDNLKECSRGKITAARPPAEQGPSLRDVSSDRFEYICTQRRCTAAVRPHIHIFQDGTGAGWPTGGEHKIMHVGNMDEAMMSIAEWKTNNGRGVDGAAFTMNGWSSMIQCVIDKTKVQTGYEYPLTYNEYIRTEGEHIAVLLGKEIEQAVYDSIKRKGATLFQNLVNISLLVSGGEPGPIRLTRSTPALKDINMDNFYTNLAKLITLVNKIYIEVDTYCATNRLLTPTQRGRVVGNTTKKIETTVSRLIRDTRRIDTIVSALSAIKTPRNADPICVNENGGRRTRRKNGRRRTQKKRKTYV
jgi:hypothetical protein